VAGNEVLYGLARTRAIVQFGRPGEVTETRALGEQALTLFESHLQGREWLTLEQPGLADVACYPYVALAPEGGFDLTPLEAVRRWLERVAALPGWVGMPGLYPGPQRQ